MKVLPVDQFLKLAEQEMPEEFRSLAHLACVHVQGKINVILDSRFKKDSVEDTKRRLHLEYKSFIQSARRHGFEPVDPLDPFQIINYLA